MVEEEPRLSDCDSFALPENDDDGFISENFNKEIGLQTQKKYLSFDWFSL